MPEPGPRWYSRRQVLAAGLGVTAAAAVASGPASAASRLPAPLIRGRDDWARGLAPTGPLRAEPDVRFLVVHHSDTANGYSRQAVPELLRGIYAFHTAHKQWPDVAYNFFVDAYGRIWEGRSGSAAGPVAGSATGGNCGLAQLICFLGNHTVTPPTARACAAAVHLLAWLADREGIPTAPGSTATFRSGDRTAGQQGQS